MRSLLSILMLLAFLAGCSQSQDRSESSPTPEFRPLEKTIDRSEFPVHWWQEVPRNEAKSWEILPQDAGPNEVVLSKRNELGLLSNFADTSFVFNGQCYASVEAFWQMMKFPESDSDIRMKWTSKWKYSRFEVSQMDGYSAKSAGSYANKLMETHGATWVTFESRQIPLFSKKPGIHYRLIQSVLIEKARQNPAVLEALLKTRDLILKPDHKISERSPPQWFYNELWMGIRKQFQDGALGVESQEDGRLKNCGKATSRLVP